MNMSKDVFEEVPSEDLHLEEGLSRKPTIFDPFGRIADIGHGRHGGLDDGSCGVDAGSGGFGEGGSAACAFGA